MAQDRSTVDAILTEHFRYTPLSVIDDIINSVNSIIYKALTALESGLSAQSPKNLGFGEPKSTKSKPKASEVPTASDQHPPPPSASAGFRAEIENGTHALETLLSGAVDKNFDIFELFALQHIFSIDAGILEHVRLKHTADATWPLGADDAVPESLAEKRRELRAERELGLVLQRENRLLDEVLAQLRGLVGKDGDLAIIVDGQMESEGKQQQQQQQHYSPLSTTAQFSASQLPGLKILVRELKAKMALLPGSAEELRGQARGRDAPGSTGNEERKRYVESVARRAVRENLGVQGELGDEIGLGPARSMGEVLALERLLGNREEGEQEQEQEQQEEEESDAEAGRDHGE